MIDTSNIPQRKNYNDLKKKIVSVFSGSKPKKKEELVRKNSSKPDSVFKKGK